MCLIHDWSRIAHSLTWRWDSIDLRHPSAWWLHADYVIYFCTQLWPTHARNWLHPLWDRRSGGANSKNILSTGHFSFGLCPLANAIFSISACKWHSEIHSSEVQGMRHLANCGNDESPRCWLQWLLSKKEAYATLLCENDEPVANRALLDKDASAR